MLCEQTAEHCGLCYWRKAGLSAGLGEFLLFRAVQVAFFLNGAKLLFA